MLTRRDALATFGGAAAWLATGCSATGPLLRSRSPRRIQTVLPGLPTLEGAGVKVTRVIGQPRLRHVDPFILLDRFHSHDPRDYIKGFPSHPHRGFETITVMLEGKVRHADSVGNRGVIRGGGIQWMTAGRGIVHSEMPEPIDSSGLMSGFQFWLNLHAREKMRAPEYQDMTREQIPQLPLSSGGGISLIAGPSLDTRGAVAPRTIRPILMTVRLEDDQPLRVDIPEGHTSFLFVHDGEVRVGESTVGEGHIAILTDGNEIEARAPTRRSGFVLAAAAPIGEPIVQRGPFVMNTQAEIRQAFADYRNGTLAR